MTSTGMVILIAIVFALVGFVSGVAAIMIISNRDKAGAGGKKISPDHDELLTLLREREGNRIAIAIGDKLIRSVDELTEKQRRAVGLLSRDWEAWIAEMPAEAPPADQPATAEPSPFPEPLPMVDQPPFTEPLPQVDQPPFFEPLTTVDQPPFPGPLPVPDEPAVTKPLPPLEQPVPAEPAAPVEELVFAEPAPPAVQPPPPEPHPQPGQAKHSEQEEEPEGAATNIVVQINQVLQEKVIGTPYENGYLHLSEDTQGGGVTVWLGTEQFGDLDSVPDESARNVIRSAVKEWEQRASSMSLRSATE